MSYASDLSSDLSPIRLSYAAALRHVKPLNPQDGFSYAQVGVFTPLNFMALAASNPQGKFYALISNDTLLKKAQKVATERQVTNATFISSTDELPMNLTYLCYENITTSPSEEESIFDLAEKHLAPSGLLCYRYHAYNNHDDCLRFLVEEYAPELSDEQALEFLSELKILGTTYFSKNLIAQNALNNAIDAKDPSLFFTTCIPNDDTSIASGTFEVMKNLLERSFSFAGSADIAANYIQLAAPAETHDTLEKCKGHLLYEIIKDFTIDEPIRSDIWVKQPVTQTDDLAELYGFFTYGIMQPRDRVPQSLSTNGTSIPLTSPLFTRLIDLMCTLPMTIGDFLQHPSGEGMDPDEVIAAVQVLVACGLAKPMRTHYEGKISADVEAPKWSNTFNDYLTHLAISEPTVLLASPIVGSPLTIPARDAMVMQALHRVGMRNCAGVLLPEIETLIKNNPALAAQILDAADPSDETIRNILTTTITRSMTSWYAYGLLAA